MRRFGRIVVEASLRGRAAFAYKREFAGTVTLKRAIFIIIPIRSSRCAYYKFPPVIFFSRGLYIYYVFIYARPTRQLSPVSLGSLLRITCKITDDFTSGFVHARLPPSFSGSVDGVRYSFHRRYSAGPVRLNGRCNPSFCTVERAVSYRRTERRSLLPFFSSPFLPFLPPLFDTQLAVFYGIALSLLLSVLSRFSSLS